MGLNLQDATVRRGVNPSLLSANLDAKSLRTQFQRSPRITNLRSSLSIFTKKRLKSPSTFNSLPFGISWHAFIQRNVRNPMPPYHLFSAVLTSLRSCACHTIHDSFMPDSHFGLRKHFRFSSLLPDCPHTKVSRPL